MTVSKNKNLRINLLLFVVLTLISQVARSQLNPESCSLRYAWNEWKPYQFLNSKGELQGSQIDFVKYVAKRLDCEISFVRLSHKESLSKLKKGEVDLIGSVTRSELVDSGIYFSTAYATSYFVLLVNKNKKSAIQNQPMTTLLERGFRLGVITDRFYGIEFEVLRSSNSIYEYIDVPGSGFDLYTRLNSGEIDGFLENPLSAAFTLRERKLSSNIVRSSNVFFSSPVFLVFSQASVDLELVEEFNQIIKQIRSNPTLQKRWNFRYEESN